MIPPSLSFGQQVSARLLSLAWRVLARCSPRLRRSLGWVLAILLYGLARRRRQVAARNLQLCFAQASSDWRRRVLRAHFRALAQSLVDRAVLWFGSPKEIDAILKVEGLEHWPTDRPVILLAPHFVGLDAGWTALTRLRPVVSMYQPQRNPALDALIYARRLRFGQARLIGKHEGIRGLVRCLSQHLPVYYLPDMDFGLRNAVFAPFFGVPAATLVTLAKLTAQYQACVVPCLTHWDPHTGWYTVHLQAAWQDFPVADLHAAASYMNQAIEAWVRIAPEQYLWPHKRFKTRPPGTASVY